MGSISQLDFVRLVSENYITLLLLAGLVIIMIAYRENRLAATKNFQHIIVIILLMSISFSAERWAIDSPDRIDVRIWASVIHYLLQPFIIYFELVIIMPPGELKDRTKKWLLALPIIINSAIYLAAPFAGTLVFSYDSNYHFNRGPLGWSIYIVTYLYLGLLLVWSIRFFRLNDKRKSIILFFMVGIAVLTGILEALNIATGFIDESFALGLLIYYIYLITVHEAQMQANLVSKELELSQNKVRLLRNQIQPHFVFNSLQIIKSLIRTDQAKAVVCLEDFSDYLRANLDAITSDKLVSFDTELSHIDAYTALALADSSKNINIEYDIKERLFYLPPLTIEPLVENAIRHGVSKGGTVTISTRALSSEDLPPSVKSSPSGDPMAKSSTAESPMDKFSSAESPMAEPSPAESTMTNNYTIVITVSDDGAGFTYDPDSDDRAGFKYDPDSGDGAGFTYDPDNDPAESEAQKIAYSGATEKETRRLGIGLENVRTRLETMCGGRMEINSSSNGTEVNVYLPVTNSAANQTAVQTTT